MGKGENVEMNKEITLVSRAYSTLAISPNNKTLVAVCGTVCHVLAEHKKSESRRLAHDSEVVAAFFRTNTRLITVTEDGEVAEFEEKANRFEKIVSRRVTAFPVVAAFAQKPRNEEEEKDQEMWYVVKKSDADNGEPYDVCVSSSNGSIVKVLEIPYGLRREQISIQDDVVSYCQGLEVHSIILKEKERTVLKTTKHVAKNGGNAEDGDVQHRFERIATNGNFLIAAISDGRVHQWSNLKSEGVSDTYHRIHWHKVGPHIAVTQFGNVLSAGAECVLARSAKGQAAPTLLPRLSAPVTGLVLSNDSSTCAVIMEDNSVHTVLLSTFAIKTSYPTLEFCPRSLNTVFYTDPHHPREIVMNGKPGTLQWFDPVTVVTQSKMHVTLENAVDGDMTSRGIRSAFRDCLTCSFNERIGATIEKFVNFDGENHVRFWKRRGMLGNNLISTVAVARDVVFIATCATTSSRFVRKVVTASTGGTMSVWHVNDNDVREDLELRRNWQEAEITAVSNIQADGKFASAHNQHVVLWNVKNMKIIDVLSCDASVQKLSFTSEGRYLIVSTKKSTICWDTLCLLVAWRIQQSVGITVNSVGCFAYTGTEVMRFDAETGRVLGTVKFSSPVDDLIVLLHLKEHVIYVAKTKKGILSLRPSRMRGGGKVKPDASDLDTPFHQVPQINSSAVSADQQFSRQPRPEAAGLFQGPVMNLPPISYIAPLFIEKALLPPPVRPSA